MSSRPTTVVTHPSSSARRQLVPSLLVAPPVGLRWNDARSRAFLRSLGLATPDVPAHRAQRRALVERLADAVAIALGLPGVLVLAPGRALPDEQRCDDPLVWLAIATRCSGPVWLRDRPPASERLVDTRPRRLLVPARLRARVLAVLGSGDWPRVAWQEAGVQLRAGVPGAAA